MAGQGLSDPWQRPAAAPRAEGLGQKAAGSGRGSGGSSTAAVAQHHPAGQAGLGRLTIARAVGLLMAAPLVSSNVSVYRQASYEAVSTPCIMPAAARGHGAECARVCWCMGVGEAEPKGAPSQVGASWRQAGGLAARPGGCAIERRGPPARPGGEAGRPPPPPPPTTTTTTRPALALSPSPARPPHTHHSRHTQPAPQPSPAPPPSTHTNTHTYTHTAPLTHASQHQQCHDQPGQRHESGGQQAAPHAVRDPGGGGDDEDEQPKQDCGGGGGGGGAGGRRGGKRVGKLVGTGV